MSAENVFEGEHIIGFDYEAMYSLTNKELVYKLCDCETMPTLHVSVGELARRVFETYQREMLRRMRDGKMHPDDYTESCKDWEASKQ